MARSLFEFFMELESAVHDELTRRAARKLKSIDDLKRTGTVTEETETLDGIVTKKVRYESFDGSTTIYREESYPADAEKRYKLTTLRRERIQAAQEQRYEDAAKLRDEIRELEQELGVDAEEPVDKPKKVVSAKRV